MNKQRTRQSDEDIQQPNIYHGDDDERNGIRSGEN